MAVTLMHAKPGQANNELVFPATLQAIDEAPLYARVNGYVRAWLRGHRQACAAKQNPGRHRLARGRLTTDPCTRHAQPVEGQPPPRRHHRQGRYGELIKDNSVAQQEVDQNLAAQQASVVATTADVAQFQQQQKYEQIVAPFDGVVTERRINIGDLVNAGNSGTSALFRIARISTMRVFVSVPEAYSQQITEREPVQLTLTELPGQTFTGKVTRTDHAIDVNTRTLLVEIDVPNGGGKLIPGRVRPGSLQAAVQHASVARSHRRHSLPDGRAAGRGGRYDQPRAASKSLHRARLRQQHRGHRWHHPDGCPDRESA